MVDIFDEVEEELRAERAQQLLKRYSGLIIAAALVIIGAAAGWQGWRWYQARQDAAAASEFLTAMTLADAATAAGSSAASRTAAIAGLCQRRCQCARRLRHARTPARGGAEGRRWRSARRRRAMGPGRGGRIGGSVAA